MSLQLWTPAQAQAQGFGDHRACRYVQDAHGQILNLHTEQRLLYWQGELLPLTINQTATTAPAVEQSYVVSPLSTFGSYAHYELRQLQMPWLTWPLHGLVAWFRQRMLHADMDHVVHLNNWQLSTNLYPCDWLPEDIPNTTAALCQQFPEHALVFRSLNDASNPQLLAKFAAAGYLPVPSRQVYLFDGKGDTSFSRKHNYKLDSALWRKTHYQRVDGSALAPSDFDRLSELYNQLYRQKYCTLNPQYSAAWLQRGVAHGWLQLEALRHPSGRFDGVVGWFEHEQIITAPIVGYDLALAADAGLYRLLTQLCLARAAQTQRLLNFSSGAAHFKRLRGGLPQIEYSMVYIDHLAPRRQRVWRQLSQLLQRFAVPLMQRYQL